ncbi:hypothetical protein PAHAL_9G621600 [Panicum hallii]|uniref:Uncharacterized protein n=1 Tax=Panicum hallii TaxID=206008 RepID=A0A2T8I6K4_9POAL|nr:hypothetical protein PAHAL_9G621600 [Panicum hallii]
MSRPPPKPPPARTHPPVHGLVLLPSRLLRFQWQGAVNRAQLPARGHRALPLPACRLPLPLPSHRIALSPSPPAQLKNLPSDVPSTVRVAPITKTITPNQCGASRPAASPSTGLRRWLSRSFAAPLSTV